MTDPHEEYERFHKCLMIAVPLGIVLWAIIIELVRWAPRLCMLCALAVSGCVAAPHYTTPVYGPGYLPAYPDRDAGVCR